MATVATDTTRKLTYRADIDGLRAVAVLSVLFFHARLGFEGGFVGVDVFFVISGFLISSIIDREINEGRFTYRGFWERRIRRLFPAMAVVVLASSIAGYFLLLPHDYREFGQSVVAQTFAASNFFFCREQGYFAGPSDIKPLLHTWSLSVEEQFYLIMPALLLFLRRFCPTRVTTALCVILVASFAWCVYSTPIYPNSAFYLLATRAWELLLGGLVGFALANREFPKKYAEITSLLGAVAIVGSIFFYDAMFAFPGWFAAIPCVGTAMVVAGNHDHETTVSKLLSWRPVVAIGLISYSLYLWHWPLFAFANYLSLEGLSTGLAVTLVALSIVCGWLSWRFVEQPFRHKPSSEKPASQKRVFALAGLTIAGLVLIGLLIHLQNGFRFRCDAATLQLADARGDKNQYRKQHHDLSANRLAKQPKVFAQRDSDLEPQVVVIGDSHADALMPGIVKACEQALVPMVAFTRSATIPLCFGQATESDTEQFYEAVKQQLKAHPSLKRVLLVARWTAYKPDDLNKESLAGTIESLQSLGLEVIVVRQVPEPRGDVPRFLALRKWGFGNLPSVSTTAIEHDESRKRMDQLLSELEASPEGVVDLSAELFGADGNSIVERDGKALYFDSNHLSSFGAELLANQIAQVLPKPSTPGTNR